MPTVLGMWDAAVGGGGIVRMPRPSRPTAAALRPSSSVDLQVFSKGLSTDGGPPWLARILLSAGNVGVVEPDKSGVSLPPFSGCLLRRELLEEGKMTPSECWPLLPHFSVWQIYIYILLGLLFKVGRQEVWVLLDRQGSIKGVTALGGPGDRDVHCRGVHQRGGER